MARYYPRWTKLILPWWESWFGSRRHAPRRRGVLRVEPLESRWVPTTFTVDHLADDLVGSGLNGSLRYCIANAANGDDIQFGVTGTITLTSGQLAIAKSLDITGPGADKLAVSGNYASRVFYISGQVTVSIAGLTVTKGHVESFDDVYGGGILNNGGEVTLDNVVVQNNVAQADFDYLGNGSGFNALGGGIYSAGGTLTITGGVITNNQAIGGHGIWHNFTLPPGGSGAGGGLYSTGGALTIAGATIANNQAIGGGGASTASEIKGGDGGSAAGGGLYATAGTLDIADTSIAGNQATGGPAGMGASFFGQAGTGGTGQGGGLYVSGSSLSISASTVASNQAMGGSLGGPSPYGSDGAGQGGGLYNGGTLAVSNCTVSGNSSINGGVNGYAMGGGGGGIYNNGAVTVSNSSLSSNSAVVIYGFGVEGGGGLFVHAGLPVLHNTLIAGNSRVTTGTSHDDISGALNPGGDYNLIGDGTGMTGLQNGVNGNLVGSAAVPIDPLLGPLQDNGGPTQTMALSAGSPALNAGDPAQLGVADQRGVVRSGGVNIGAYQASASAFVLTAPATATAGTPFDVKVKAVDSFLQTAVGYTGTVTFSTTDPDPGVVLPADYTFTLADGGAHTFTNTGLGETTLITPGDQMIVVADTADGTINGGATVTVTAGMAPLPRWAVPRPPTTALGPPQDQPPAPGEPSRPEMAVADWLFASLSRGDAEIILSPPTRHSLIESPAWALDRFGDDEALVT
jgi:hypothetical protein